MAPSAIYIQDFAITCPLGRSAEEVAGRLFSAAPPVISGGARLIDGRAVPVGRAPLDDDEDGKSTRNRSNDLLADCLDQIGPAIAAEMERVGAHRVGIVLGTSTSGIGEVEIALRERLQSGEWSPDFDFGAHELGDPALFAAQKLGTRGPAYAISTACTSGAKAISAAARLIQAGICDSVICGGVDALCGLTLNGFAALDSLSDAVCNPFSANRRGINIGEGAAILLVSAVPAEFRLAGWGESSDGYHMNAPDPTGAGAELAIRRALTTAGMAAADIGYAHLHGTATRLNDEMEAKVMHRLFGDDLACSSTKPFTGHLLGATGACQAIFCLLAMRLGYLPPHWWDGVQDPLLPVLRLVEAGERVNSLRAVLSASYAFGGNNIGLVFARA